MKPTLALGLLAACLAGCAADPIQLESDKTYQVEWIGERPLIDRSHLTLTLGEDGRAPTATPAATTGSRPTPWRATS
jgi:heat shock protein HslJ